MEKLSEKISLTSQTFSDSSEARTILSFRIEKGDEHEDASYIIVDVNILRGYEMTSIIIS